MMSKTKKSLLFAVVIALLCCTAFAMGITAFAADVAPATLKSVKAEQPENNLYAKFVLKDESGNALRINTRTNLEGIQAQDTDNVFFKKILFNLNGNSQGGAFKGENTFDVLYAKHTHWNLHVGHDTVGGDTATFMVNANSIYAPVPGDTITLLAGLRPMQNTASNVLEYVNYELKEEVTVVYDNDNSLRVLPADEVWGIIADSKMSVASGSTKQIEAKLVRAHTTTASDKITYASSDESIATVDENGVVSGVDLGTATITATASGKEKKITVTVGAAITLNKETLNVRKGTSSTIKATSILTDTTVTWSTSDDSIATVENGTVTGVGKGSATITATAANGNTATCEVNVAEEIEIYDLEDTLTLTMGKSQRTAKTLTSNDPAVTKTSVSWTISNNETVRLLTSNTTIDGTEKKASNLRPHFIPLKPGTVTATATINGTNIEGGVNEVTRTLEITVVSKISVSKSVVNVEKGKTYTLTATVNPDTMTYSWSSSDETVATVDANGVVTAKKAGIADITVTTADGQTAVTSVEVVEAKAHVLDKCSIVGAGQIQVRTYNAGGDYTNFEVQKSNPDFTGFFDNFLIDGFKITELSGDETRKDWNPNIHFLGGGGYIAIYVFKGATEVNLPVGTTVSFKAGCMLPTKRDGQWVDSGYRIMEDTTWKMLNDKTWAAVSETSRVESISIMDGTVTDGCYEFRVTLNTLAYMGESTSADTDAERLNKLKINGKTITEINEANPDGGVEVYYYNKDIIIDIYKTAKIDGKEIVDIKGHGTSFTIADGFKAPESGTFEEDYVKYYYGDMNWWSDEYVGKPQSEQKIEIASISKPVEDSQGGNLAFIITFTENVFNPTVHINGVCSWQNTTPYAGQIDGQLTSGFKAAIWYGIRVDGKTVYEYMFNTNQSNAVNQSTVIAVHSDNRNTLRIVFQKELNSGFELGKNHTLEFLADKFYTNTGATFASNQIFSYNNATETWTNNKEITEVTLDKSELKLQVGGTAKLTATVNGGEHADKSVTFASSDNSVVTVDANGNLKAIAAGTATITVTASDGKTATCTVTVIKKSEPPKKSGCGSNIASVSGMGAAVILGAVMFILIKRRKTVR